MFENSDLEPIIQKRKHCLHIPVKIITNKLVFYGKDKIRCPKRTV